MELVIILVIAIAVLAYYGFTKSLEQGASMATREMSHLQDVHDVSLIERTAKLNERISEETINKATEVRAKLEAMRG